MSHERDDLVSTLTQQRGFLLHTTRGLTLEEASRATTVSSLTLASLLKHVAETEESWQRFAVGDPEAWGPPPTDGEWVDTRFVVPQDATIEGLRARVQEVAARTEQLLRTEDLDAAHPLPEAPWFEHGASWTLRRVALHLISEISQHAGHADIIREALDGQRTMG